MRDWVRWIRSCKLPKRRPKERSRQLQRSIEGASLLLLPFDPIANVPRAGTFATRESRTRARGPARARGSASARRVQVRRVVRVEMRIASAVHVAAFIASAALGCE